MKNRSELIEVAAGRKKADLVFKNAQVVNVFTGEILPGDVAVAGGYIAGVGRYAGEQELDCTGKTLCPGFVDAHLHIESTMVTPARLVEMALPSGTTTMVADPHEIVNVCGAEGMRFMLEASRNLPCNLYYMLPSSVPATPFETAGADFTARDMEPFLNDPQVLGLGEVMCFTDLVAGRPEILDKLALLDGRAIDGHAPGLAGHDLQAYAAAGVMTEHECTTFEEAAEKARAGLAILVREGSAAHNLSTIVNGLVESDMPTDRFLFCTDDKHLDDTARDGHIRWNVKLAIELGLPPVEAVRMASYNAARVYGLRDVGAVAAGYRADLVLLDSLEQVEVATVYKDGVPAGTRLAAPLPALPDIPAVYGSVKAPAVTPEALALPLSEPADVIDMVPYQLITRRLTEAVPLRDGRFAPDGTYSKLCVVERHGKGGAVQVAPLKGYGITGGAIATSVAHDSHNIIAAGDSDRDIALAVNTLREMGGGYVLVRGGSVAGRVPLPIAGLMSDRPGPEVQQAVGDILQKAEGMGIPYYIDPFISLSFLALPVIPSIRLTDKGLFDVEAFALIR